MLFWPKLAQKWIFGQDFRKSNSGFGISFSKIPCVTIFFGKTDNFDFFSPNLPKNEFWGENFKNLSPDLETAPRTYHVCQFLVKAESVEFFGLNLGKLPNCMRYFRSNNVEGVAESWVELGRAEWRWMELSGGGCTVL